MSVADPLALRRAFGRYLTGVTVVTTRTEAGEPIGFTANSFTSVSLEPPLLLVCPGRQLSSFSAFATCDHFAVNVLAEGQETIASTFARSDADRFNNVAWRDDAESCPWLDGVAAAFGCRTHRRVDAGDHLVLIGEIRQFEQRSLRGLGYCSEGYFSLGDERRAEAPSAPDRTGVAGALIEVDDALLVIPTHDGLELPTCEQAEDGGALSTMTHYLAEHGLAVDWGAVYSIYDVGARRFTFLRARARARHDGAIGRYVPFDRLDPADFDDTAQRALVTRFLAERTDGRFGLYVGGAERGEVHALTGGG